MSTSEAAEPRVDVAVVGGGLAGLVAAATAAEGGARVVLLEPHGLGGRAATDEQHGYRFNRGPRALYSGHGRAVLERMGMRPTGGPPMLGAAMAVRRGELHRLPVGAGALITTSLLGVRAKASFGAFYARVGKADLDELAGMTQSAWLDELDLHPDARQLAESLGRLSSYAHGSSLVSADVMAAQMSIKGGVTYLDRGWSQIVDFLRDCAVARGVEIRDAQVTAIEPGGTAVRVSGNALELVAGRVVLAAGGARSSASLLPEPPVAWKSLAPEIAAACLDLGLQQPAEHPFVHGIDDPLYLSTHCPPADMAPEGGAVVHVMRYLTPDEEPESTAMRACLQAHAAMAGIREDQIGASRYLRRMVVAGAFPTPENGGLRGRPGIASTGFERVLVAGDWIGPDGFLADAAIVSGESAGRVAAAP